EKGSVADALLIEECGANQYAVADNIDRGIDVPLVLALLPEQFGLGRGKLILRRGECKGVGLLRDLILCLQFLKGSRFELLEFGSNVRLPLQGRPSDLEAHDARIAAADVGPAIDQGRRAFDVDEIT